MARILSDVQAFIDTDANGDPVGNEEGVIEVMYTVTDNVTGATKSAQANRPLDGAKIVHDTGAVGEWWRDTIDVIKGVEGIV
jgi:hypothetical protein